MGAAPAVDRPTDPARAERDARPHRDGVALRRPPWPLLAVGAAVVAGVVLRLYTSSPLWLDEALTVEIARRPWPDLFDALRHDGAPPLFYALLHTWIAVVGDGDQAVRLLPALFSVATLPLAWRMGLRRGGHVAGAAVVVFTATSPFALRYATEARMYSLVALLVAAGWLAIVNALERPTLRWLALVGLCTGALLLTHYWGFYLVAAVCIALVIRRPRRRAHLLTTAAIVAGGAVCFAPWVPSFLFQLRHTGTPWGEPPNPIDAGFTTLVDLGGGPHPEGQAIAGVLAALTLLALFGRAADQWRIELDLRTRPGVRADLLVAVAAVLIGLAAGLLTGSAWASRYTSIAFPIVMLAAGYGLRAIEDRRIVAGVLSVAALVGVAGGVRNVVTDRTQAREVASTIAASWRGEGTAVIAYCPDQLGPDVNRVLHVKEPQYTFPDFGPPSRVDWVDYADRMQAADPDAFAHELRRRAGDRDVFYVWMPGYRTHDTKCERINDVLADTGGGSRQLLEPDADTFERHGVWLHEAAGGAP